MSTQVALFELPSIVSSRKEPQKFAGLRERQKRLVEEEEKAWLAVAEAHAISDLFARAFNRAHGACEALWVQRKAGVVIHERDWFAAYDARTVASHEWGPSKKHMQEVERWLKEIRRELKIVNEELGK